MMKHIAYPGFGNDEGTNQEVLINYLLRGIKRNISNWPVWKNHGMVQNNRGINLATYDLQKT